MPHHIIPSSSRVASYAIQNSVRIRAQVGACLIRNPTTSNRKTWTFSTWLKRGALSYAYPRFFTAGAYGFAYASYTTCYFNSVDQLCIDSGQYGVIDDWYLYSPGVFRDPAAWYHIVYSVDTTQATAANRVKIYVNGVQIALTGTYPPLNYDTLFNTTGYQIGLGGINGGATFDGLLAETIFVDGLAFAPVWFGSVNYDTGVWSPVSYTGIYGTNGFRLQYKPSTVASYGYYSSGASGYYLGGQAAFAFGSGDFTIEMMVMQTGNGAYAMLYDGRPYGTSGYYPCLYVGPDNLLYYYTNSTNVISGGTTLQLGLWYHVAVSRVSGVTRMFMDGNQTGASYTDGTVYLNGANRPTLGVNGLSPGAGYDLTGYISNVRVVSQGLYSANFTPPAGPLTAVANTQLLTLQNATAVDNSVNAFTVTPYGTPVINAQYPFLYNIAADASPYGNSFTPVKINTAVDTTSCDMFTDSPTSVSPTIANYCVLDPLTPGLTYAPLVANLSGSNANVYYGTIRPRSGKFYFEFQVAPGTTDAYMGMTPFLYRTDGTRYNGSTWAAYGAAYTGNDIIGGAFDLDGGTFTFYKNGVSQGTVSVTYTFPTFPHFYVTTGYFFNVNFGQQPWRQSPPSGYVALNSFNLAAPTVTKPSKYMDVSTYSGTGATQAIANAGFTPGLVVIKDRSVNRNHRWMDSARGINNVINSDSPLAESAGSGLASLDTLGFTLNTTDNQNLSGETYVAWQWAAGASLVTNTTGIITSQVSANPAAGFSIVLYDGTGSGGTIGHGLGVAPELIHVKNRNDANGGSGRDWRTYLKINGAANTQYLDLQTAQTSDIAAWNSTQPTSSVFSVGNSVASNGAGFHHVAYCWASIPGYSMVGSYVGNGSGDGPHVFTDFCVKFLMIKAVNYVSNWVVRDSVRDAHLSQIELDWNLYNAESAAGAVVDLLSNGFKLRDAGSYATNGSGITYAFIAFAESPFKYTLAR